MKSALGIYAAIICSVLVGLMASGVVKMDVQIGRKNIHFGRAY
jgi:hypothetical protein